MILLFNIFSLHPHSNFVFSIFNFGASNFIFEIFCFFAVSIPDLIPFKVSIIKGAPRLSNLSWRVAAFSNESIKTSF